MTNLSGPILEKKLVMQLLVDNSLPSVSKQTYVSTFINHDCKAPPYYIKKLNLLITFTWDVDARLKYYYLQYFLSFFFRNHQRLSAHFPETTESNNFYRYRYLIRVRMLSSIS